MKWVMGIIFITSIEGEKITPFCKPKCQYRITMWAIFLNIKSKERTSLDFLIIEDTFADIDGWDTLAMLSPKLQSQVHFVLAT